MYTCNEQRMGDMISTFARFGDAGHGGITRYALSPEDAQARAEFKRRMEAIGATVTCDDLANMYAVLPGSDQGARRITMGSHSDSVRNGGNYDGILGVMSAMEVLTTVAEQGIFHRHPLCAMIWTNEEGSLYPPSMMCSGIVCHDALPLSVRDGFVYDNMMAVRAIDGSGVTFGDALARFPYRGDASERMSRENTRCYFETHIEQGPILEEAGCDVGVVDCVLGMFTYWVRLHGETTHAGTFPMPRRKDALFAAAQVIEYLHERIDALGIPDLVYTTGEVTCHPNVHTCVPDLFEFSLDVRHTDPAALDRVREVVREATRRTWAGCTCEVELAWQRDTTPFNAELRGFVEDACVKTGVTHMPIHSGAGHDAQFAAYLVPTTMVFVQSRGGLSHCEREFTSARHATEGATVMLNAVLEADQKLSS